MALVIRDIRKTIIDSVKAAIGNQLTQETNPATMETYGLVMNARPNKEIAIPDYPYAVLDLLMIRDDDWYVTQQGINADGDWEYQTHKQIDFQITIYGSDSLSLAEQLSTSYRRVDILQILSEGSLGLVSVESVTIQPELLQTDFLEVGVVKLSVRANDIYTDDSLDYFENVTGTGELEHFDGDPSPLTIDVDTR